MHFKALELIGFKSFADKTKLNFEPGVTAVVGPNGCGKSNIADAIRWVLGEQSAKSLRASSMSDVIFNGTDNKEPTNMAEVSLTFSNENRALPIDYDEVTISRRAFRSGENEYLLNKTPVRLKDISELLMGTGLNTDSYSVMEQGKMDMILSSKPEDRRYVFEEASGITKYKSKKKEALRKLEQTEQNLLRINDIITEVKRQIGSIERQARKAERYKVDYEKLKEFEVKLSFSEYRELRTQEKTISVGSEDVKTREKDLDTEVRGMSEKMSAYRQSADEVNTKMSELRNSQGELSNTLDMNTHKIEIDRERIAEALSLQESLKKEIGSILSKIETSGFLVQKLKEDLARIEEEASSRKRLLEEKEGVLSGILKWIEETESRVKSLKVQVVDYLAKETRLKNELIKISADLQNRKSRQRRIELEKDNVERDLGAVSAELEAIRKEFQQAESSATAMQSDLDAKKSDYDKLITETNSLECEIAGRESARAAAGSKIEMLEEMLKSYEGFGQGVKNIMAIRFAGEPASFGIHGVLAEIIKVERGYEEAISVFLGDHAQVIVMESDADIERAIEHLSQSRSGRANFISLETLKKIASRAPMTDHSTLRPVKDFVRIAPGFEAVVDYFFADAYVAGDLSEASRAAASLPTATIVTKDGRKFDRGVISGGSSSDSEEALLIGRRDRLESMKLELAALETRLEILALSRKEKTELRKTLESQMDSIEESLRAEEIKAANIKTRKDSREENERRIIEEFQVLALELDESLQSIDELTKKGESMNAELNEIAGANSHAQSFINDSQIAIIGKREEKESLGLEMATLRTQFESVDRDLDNIRNNEKKEASALFEMEGSLASKNDAIKEYDQRIATFDEEIKSLSAGNGSITAELEALGMEIAGVEKSKSEIMDKLSLDALQLKEKERGLESLRNQIRDADVKITELLYRKNNLKDRILQAHKVDLETFYMELDDNADWESIKSQVTELRERLDKMGPVNLVAIEEHKELEERCSFLSHQQEDLLNAKDSLMKAIQKINKTTKELFLDAFQKIQVEFKSFFKLLFGGGQAELILIDEQDVLESGIEIIARPPGKKLQNIMLLSGGEKAMTAIALLFSIFKVRPSPFCVLDEIDAPLDESNVIRFSNVLKDFLKISQFIIITHNKRTIELADVMYGITMQEKGVSKIVSVKFMDNKKQEEDETQETQEKDKNQLQNQKLDENVTAPA